MKEESKRIVIIMIAVLCTAMIGLCAYFVFSVYGESNFILAKVFIVCLFMLVGFAILALYFIYSHKEYDKKMEKLAYQDPLTGVRNLNKFVIDAEKIIVENKGKNIAFIYSDIVNFKYVNDVFGYETGDKLLQYCARLLEEYAGEDDIFARASSDNFVGLRIYQDKEELQTRFLGNLLRDFPFADTQRANFVVKACSGIFCTEDSDEKLGVKAMLDRANIAEKSIKNGNSEVYAFYNEDLRIKILKEKEIEAGMEDALKNGEFKMFFQPKFDIQNRNKLTSAEALVRWEKPEKGIVSPGEFIPLFEKNGFIMQLDQFMLTEVCRYLKDRIEKGLEAISISVNVSRVDMFRPDFVDEYAAIKEAYQIPSGIIELEFTEGVVFANHEMFRNIVARLKEKGFTCSLDDFGAGHSSLNVLKDLPMDVLKMDMLFFKRGEDEEKDRALIASVVTMSHALKMKTVAEGVETMEQVDFLREIGCEFVQGYVFSKPLPARELAALMDVWEAKIRD